MSSVSVVIPFASTDSWRIRHSITVRAFYEQQLPGFQLVSPRWTQQTEPAARIADLRNAGADYTDTDIIVFNDADSLVEPEHIRDAAALATVEPGLVFAYTVYSRLGPNESARIGPDNWRDAFTAPVAWQMHNSMSAGCIAIRRDYFAEVGGFDTSWRYGFEDYDFAQRCAARWPLRRVEGELVHLWHPRPAVEPESGPDAERYAALYGVPA